MEYEFCHNHNQYCEYRPPFTVKYSFLHIEPLYIHSYKLNSGYDLLFVQEKASASFVGFANLPNQVFRKAVKRGFQFSLMVVGMSLCDSPPF